MSKKRVYEGFATGPDYGTITKKQRHNGSFPTSENEVSPSSIHTTTSRPALPPILDPSLHSAPFTHQGTVGGVPLSQATSTSYERLEFLGDAYLELFASRLLFTKYPLLTPGRLSQKRELLVKNETLATFALSYGFDKRATLPGDLINGARGPKEEKRYRKVLGDIFEAYVAAVILGDPRQDFTIAEEWMGKLWEPVLAADELSQKAISTSTTDDFPKVTLSKKILGKGIKLDYRHEIDPEIVRRNTKEGKERYKIGVYLTGWGWKDACLGVGEGLSKVDAGHEAAIRALEHPITKEAEGRKRAFDEGVRRERVKEKEAVER